MTTDDLTITKTPAAAPTCGACIAEAAGTPTTGFHTCDDPEDAPRYCTLEPLGPQIIVKRADPLDKTKGGILLPDSAKRKVRKGVVVRVGPGQRLQDGTRAKPEIAPGDVVVFTMYAGNEVEHEEAHGKETYLLLQEGEILTRDDRDSPTKWPIPEIPE